MTEEMLDLQRRLALRKGQKLEGAMELRPPSRQWDHREQLAVDFARAVDFTRVEYRVAAHEVWTHQTSVKPSTYRLLLASLRDWETAVRTPPLWKTQLGAAEQAIRSAWEHLEPRAAVTSISAVWSALDDAAALAEARLRLLVGRLELPEEATPPEGASKQLNEIVSHAPVLKSVAETTRRLVGAASVVLRGVVDVDPEIDIAGPGKIGINWVGGSTFLRWVIEPCEMRWPGVRVKAYTRDEETPTAVKQHRFYEAGALLALMKEVSGA